MPAEHAAGLSQWAALQPYFVSEDDGRAASVHKVSPQQFVLLRNIIYIHGVVGVNGAPLPNNNNQVYLGVTLDRSPTYKKHLESLQSKVNAKCLPKCLY